MVRQDPEPKILTTIHDFPVAAFGTATTLAGGTSITACKIFSMILMFSPSLRTGIKTESFNELGERPEVI